MQFYKLKGLEKMFTDRLFELLKEKGLKQKDLIEAVVKKVTYGADWIELHSINPEYKTRRFEGQNVTRIRILGQVHLLIYDICNLSFL